MPPRLVLDPRTAASTVLVERALDFYLAEVRTAQAPPISGDDARRIKAALAGAGRWTPELFDRLVTFGKAMWKLTELGHGPGGTVGDAITALATVDVTEGRGARWSFDPAVDPATFTRLEFREASLGIEKAQREHREGWWAHGQKNRAFISEAAATCKSRRLAVVLGAGSPFDLPLADLGQKFERLILVDIDAAALETTVKGIWKDPADRARIDLRTVDLTGINRAFVARVDEIVAAPGTAAEIEAALVALAASYRLPARPSLWGGAEERADLIVSSCVLTQLGWPQRTYAENQLEARFGKLSAEADDRLATAFSEMAMREQQDHINGLGDHADLVVLTSDVVSHRTVLDAGGTERDSGKQVFALGVDSLLERIPTGYKIEKQARWQWSRYRPTRKGSKLTEGSRMDVDAVVLSDRTRTTGGLWLPA